MIKSLGTLIFKNCANIKSLTFIGHCSIPEAQNLENLSVMHGVNALDLQYVDDGSKFLKMIQKLPNVEQLTLSNGEYLNFFKQNPEDVSELFSNLRQLTVIYDDEKRILKSIHEIKFPKLKMLIMKEMSTSSTVYLSHLKSFCLNNPTLNKIKIRVLRYENDFKISTLLPKLQLTNLIELRETAVEMCEIDFVVYNLMFRATRKFTLNRDEKDVYMFGRMLSEVEKTFFGEISREIIEL